MSSEVTHYARITNFRGQTLVKPEGVCGEWSPSNATMAVNQVTCKRCMEHIERFGSTPIKYPERIVRVGSSALA